MLFRNQSKNPLFYLPLWVMFIVAGIKAGEENPIPRSCRQMVLVLTDSVRASKGKLFRFKRIGSTEWRIHGETIPVVLGRNGLGRGAGLHNLSELTGLPLKKEGDGRSPAGVFRLSSVFGYAPAEQFINLKMPYIPITEMTECVDDVNSLWYNRLVSRYKIEKESVVDWQSSEKMRFQGSYYEVGVVVEYNRDPVAKGAGSCIFLHNWTSPEETMAGCTAMAPEKMQDIVYWLDAAADPIFIQLTKQLYSELKQRWILPEKELPMR